jgi:hypothetical protein
LDWLKFPAEKWIPASAGMTNEEQENRNYRRRITRKKRQREGMTVFLDGH